MTPITIARNAGKEIHGACFKHSLAGRGASLPVMMAGERREPIPIHGAGFLESFAYRGMAPQVMTGFQRREQNYSPLKRFTDLPLENLGPVVPCKTTHAAGPFFINQHTDNTK